MCTKNRQKVLQIPVIAWWESEQRYSWVPDEIPPIWRCLISQRYQLCVEAHWDYGIGSYGGPDDTVAIASQLIEDLRATCKGASFNLTKFISNFTDVVRTIPPEHHSSDFHGKLLDYDPLPITRALGVKWSALESTDDFGFSVAIKAPSHFRCTNATTWAEITTDTQETPPHTTRAHFWGLVRDFWITTSEHLWFAVWLKRIEHC